MLFLLSAAFGFLAVTGLPVPAIADRPNETELVEVEVKDVVPIEEVQTHAVILMTGDGTLLPVFVDEPAAVAIAFRLAHHPAPHPMVEDTLDAMVDQMGGKVTEVTIAAIQNEEAGSTVTVRQGKRELTLQARPSDCIAMALTSGAKIYATRDLVERVGITQQEIEELREQMGIGGSGPPEVEPPEPPAEKFEL